MYAGACHQDHEEADDVCAGHPRRDWGSTRKQQLEQTVGNEESRPIPRKGVLQLNQISIGPWRSHCIRHSIQVDTDSGGQAHWNVANCRELEELIAR